LKVNVKPFGSRCELFNTGIWSQTVGLVMDETNPDDRAWAKTVRPVKPGEKAAFHAMDIGTLLKGSGFERISILKIDIEGAESEIFANDAKHWLPKVDNLVIELHGPQHEKIFHAAIASEGFQLSTSWELTVCKRK
ncbi:MAG: FkbM family methyltransferase, partial [Archangium sp.]|nr:FkbM family methyltransferase [Archangium sp.]